MFGVFGINQKLGVTKVTLSKVTFYEINEKGKLQSTFSQKYFREN